MVEVAEGGVVVAERGVPEARHLVEETVAACQGLAEENVGTEPLLAGHAVFPKLSFEPEIPAVEPLTGDEGIDQRALLGGGGEPTIIVLSGESCEIGGAFAADDGRLGVEAGFQGVHGDDGLTFNGTRAGGLGGVELVGLDLPDGRHRFPLISFLEEGGNKKASGAGAQAKTGANRGL